MPTLKIVENDILPGTIIKVETDAFWVATGSGTIKISQVQLEGKKSMSAKEFLHGHKDLLGKKLG